MLLDHPVPAKRSMARSLLLAVDGRRDAEVSIGTILAGLGERSFAWSILLFAMLNLVPMPFGSNMVTAIPLILLTGQLALGYSRIRLPAAIDRRTVSRDRFRRMVIRLKPVMRPIERIVHPRHSWLFHPRAERVTGLLLFAVSLVLFAPIPMSGWIPAFALFVTALGLVERDGLIVMIGLVIGAFSILLTVLVLTALAAGASALL